MKPSTVTASPHWETVIGLEIHCRLHTNSKLFSGAAASYGAAPNCQACLIDLALPGVLPTANQAAIAMAIRFGLAIEAEIATHCQFARKNYFYPDLPKGYQISQYDAPIVGAGKIQITTEGVERYIGITRAHLEEDAGKSIHENMNQYTGIDLNRAGTPLLEIVSEPDLRTAAEAVAYMKKLHTLVRYLDICDGNMQEGSFRCDTNVSVRHHDEKNLGTRTEIKNINSFRFVEQAIIYETRRQIDVLENGGVITQETRLYDPVKNQTRSMRGKENLHDYRYFPDPDLPPIAITPSQLETIRAQLPELPDARAKRFASDYRLHTQDSHYLCTDHNVADYFEDCIKALPAKESHTLGKLCANWIMGELTAILNTHNVGIIDCQITPTQLAGLIIRIHDGTISGKLAKELFTTLWESDLDVDTLIKQQDLRQVSDDTIIAEWVDSVITEHPEQVAQYLAAATEKRKKLLGFFVGQVMKISAGKANPQQVNQYLCQQLEKLV